MKINDIKIPDSSEFIETYFGYDGSQNYLILPQVFKNFQFFNDNINKVLNRNLRVVRRKFHSSCNTRLLTIEKRHLSSL